MYKLLIVEDEEKIREGLISSIDWKSHSIELCAQAKNGIDALISFNQNQPDIILTDIRMPKMSGLEFIQQAKDTGLNFEAIVLTGYKDFDYAKHSINLNVFDYILKPAQPAEILTAVLRALEKIKQDRFMDDQLSLLEHYNDKNMYLAKIEKLNNWLSHPKQASNEDRVKIISELQMSINSHNLHVGMIHFPSQSEKSYLDDYDLLKFSVINIATETLSPYYEGKIELFLSQEKLIWIGNNNPSNASIKLESYLTPLVENFQSYLNVEIYIGISNTKESIYELHQSYVEAKQALAEHYYQKDKRAFFYVDLMDTMDKKILDDKNLSELEHTFLSNMFNKQYDAALDNLENWLSYLEKVLFIIKIR